MSFRRPHLRSRRHIVDIRYGNQPCSVWLPDPDEPLVIAEFADAANLASAVVDMPIANEVLVLLDERRRVTAMFADPPTELGLFVGWCDGPGLEVPFSQTMTIRVTAEVVERPPDATDRLGYFELRRLHMLQGLLLLDVLMVDHERVQSLAIACDPDAVWFDEFAPIEAA
ncbi:MAG: hypothetical protein ACXV5U_01865 [Ilumatobacteraceae bacterium]